jgi:hypothetical protein
MAINVMTLAVMCPEQGPIRMWCAGDGVSIVQVAAIFEAKAIASQQRPKKAFVLPNSSRSHQLPSVTPQIVARLSVVWYQT